MKVNIKKNIQAWSILVVMVSIVSCYKDKGNYTLSDINEVSINTSSTSFKLFPGDTLNIEPDVTYSMDNGGDPNRYNYRWYINDAINGVYIDISTEKNLSYKVDLPFGEYEFYFSVKDTITDIEFTKKIAVEVRSNKLNGWLILSETDTQPRLDMVSYDDDGNDSTIIDVLGLRSSNLFLTGTAVDLFCENDGNVYISTTGNGTVWVDPIYLIMPPNGHLKYSMAIPSIPLDYYAEKFSSGAFYSHGDMYTTIGALFNLPVNNILGEPSKFTVSPYYAKTGGAPLYTYDIDNKRFIETKPEAISSSSMSDGTLFDWNTGMDLVYMVFSPYNGNEVFSILKDPATSKYYLVRFDGNRTQLYYEEITTATGINLAENFTVNSEFGYVFYSVGGKLYEFDLGLKTSKLMVDYGSNLITSICAGDLAKVNDASFSGKLMVASYDPSAVTGTSGTLDVFEVPNLNDDLIKTESHTGFGKIKDFIYK